MKKQFSDMKIDDSKEDIGTLTYNTQFLVIGASVAGATMAKELSKYGKTLFTDKYLPGTLMNCGGGMPEKTFMSLGLDIPFKRIKNADLKISSKPYPFPLNYVIVHRSEFDRALYERACDAGADFMKLNYKSHDARRRVAEFRDADHKIVEISYEKLILAYGFHPRREPFSGKRRNLPFGAAIVEIIDAKTPFENKLHFEILEESPGYSWIFPMPDGKINIGTGTLSTFEIGRNEFNELKKNLKVNKKIITKGGGVFPLFTPLIINKGGVCLFGDSAGMVNVLNGEGIQHISQMAKKIAFAIAKNKNVNLTWIFSSSFLYLKISGTVFSFLRFLEQVFRFPAYAWTCKLVTKIRRMIG